MENPEEDINPEAPDMEWLDKLAKLLDNQFRIPATNIRFGLDGIIGLVPYVGDITGFVVSGILLRTMVKKGAGPLLMMRMMWNFVLDAVIGMVPVLGDLADFGYKANYRNVNMLKAYYADGKAKPNSKGSMAFLALVFFLIFAALIWGIWKFSAMTVAWFIGLF